MVRVLFREILILISCLALFPIATLVVLGFSGSLQEGLRALIGGMVVRAGGMDELYVPIIIRLFSPYLIVQAVRGYFWSQRSLIGRRWANLYFTVLLAAIGAKCAWEAWDLFYFMYALRDMPQEILQFLEMRGLSVAVLIACVILAVRSFLIFLNPYRVSRSRKSR